MNHKLSKWIDGVVWGSDGDIGKVEHFYFDDLTWIMRYMIVRPGSWLPGRSVLLSLEALGKPDWRRRVFPVNLSRDQVRNSPHTDTDEPVSREHEIELHEHYDWLGYWGGFYAPVGGCGVSAVPPLSALREPSKTPAPAAPMDKLDSRLRCAREIMGCRVHATDGDIGHIQDFLVDEESWAIRYLIVNTRNWLPGRQVLVSPRWIRKVDWDDKKVFADLSRDSIRKSPEFDPLKPLTHAYESKLRVHFQKHDAKEWVLFKYHAPANSQVCLAGTFNNWNPASIKLACHKSGVYSAMVLLPAGRCEYKFIVNGVWRNSPDCGNQVPNGFGTMNNVLEVGHRKVANELRPHTFTRLSGGDAHLQWGAPMG